MSMERLAQRTSRRAVCVFAALAFLLAAGAPGGAEAAVRVQTPPGALASSGGAVAAHIARVTDYWTPARMRSARPLDGSGGGEGGAPVASASYAWVPDSTIPPFSVNGRIFVRQGGQVGYCSGTAIDSPTRQLVLTAGHCVNSGPVGARGRSFWSQYLEFVPAYTDGQGPFGVFVAQRRAVYALSPWVRRGNPNFDMGAFLVYPNAAAQNLADAVGGGVTIALDQTRSQQFQTFGYPGRSSRLQECDSPYTGNDRRTNRLGGEPTLGIRCHWNPGASGGGWLIGGGTAINGLTSYGRRRDRIHTFSPYFSSGSVGILAAGL